MEQEKKEYGEVIITGKLISSSWWGQMWCRNIENYSELRNRLERGRSYIRRNTVKNLSISICKAEADIQGTQPEPYQVVINVKKIDKNKLKNIMNKCENSIDSLESLMMGSFPKEYQKFFTDEKYGLFPQKNEIDYKCSCPDYSNYHHMCKHIAATLYAIGNKLDVEPLIFFKLRGINLNVFSKTIIKQENEFVWENVNNDSGRKIKHDDISSLFGIEYESFDEKINVDQVLETKLTKKNQKNLNDNVIKINDIKESSNKNSDFKIEDVVDIFKKKSEEINESFEKQQESDLSSKETLLDNNIIKNNNKNTKINIFSKLKKCLLKKIAGYK